MKKTILTLAAAMITTLSAFAQAPQAFNYQGVARDNVGNELIYQKISLKVSVLQTSDTGPAVYVETHTDTTNEFGLFSLEIGKGDSISGSFTAINWGSDKHYLKVEMDPLGGTGYQFMGTSQLLSVPYALYAETSGDTAGGPSVWSKNVNDIYYNNGNVGIGTSSPSYRLDVFDGNLKIENLAPTLNSGPFIKFKEKNYNDVAGIYFQASNAGNSNQLRFTVGAGNEDPPAQYQAMVIEQDGNVGIGTTSPDGKFHVNNDVVGDDSSFVVTTTGNVGIGTTSPWFKLVVNSTTSVDIARLGNNNGNFSFHSNATSNNLFSLNSTGVASKNLNIYGYSFGQLSQFQVNAITSYFNGNVGIGTASPGGLLELSLDQGLKPSTNTWTIVSDARLKNIEGAYTKGLKEILQLQPITYHYKNTGERSFKEEVLNTLNVGFSAQKVQKIFPEAVGVDDDGYLNFNMHAILVAYVNAIKELKAEQDAEIETLKAENTAMKAEITEIKSLIGLSSEK